MVARWSAGMRDWHRGVLLIDGAGTSNVKSVCIHCLTSLFMAAAVLVACVLGMTASRLVAVVPRGAQATREAKLRAMRQISTRRARAVKPRPIPSRQPAPTRPRPPRPGPVRAEPRLPVRLEEFLARSGVVPEPFRPEIARLLPAAVAPIPHSPAAVAKQVRTPLGRPEKQPLAGQKRSVRVFDRDIGAAALGEGAVVQPGYVKSSASATGLTYELSPDMAAAVRERQLFQDLDKILGTSFARPLREGEPLHKTFVELGIRAAPTKPERVRWGGKKPIELRRLFEIQEIKDALNTAVSRIARMEKLPEETIHEHLREQLVRKAERFPEIVRGVIEARTIARPVSIEAPAVARLELAAGEPPLRLPVVAEPLPTALPTRARPGRVVTEMAMPAGRLAPSRERVAPVPVALAEGPPTSAVAERAPLPQREDVVMAPDPSAPARGSEPFEPFELTRFMPPERARGSVGPLRQQVMTPLVAGGPSVPAASWTFAPAGERRLSRHAMPAALGLEPALRQPPSRLLPGQVTPAAALVEPGRIARPLQPTTAEAGLFAPVERISVRAPEQERFVLGERIWRPREEVPALPAEPAQRLVRRELASTKRPALLPELQVGQPPLPDVPDIMPPVIRERPAVGRLGVRRPRRAGIRPMELPESGVDIGVQAAPQMTEVGVSPTIWQRRQREAWQLPEFWPVGRRQPVPEPSLAALPLREVRQPAVPDRPISPLVEEPMIITGELRRTGAEVAPSVRLPATATTGVQPEPLIPAPAMREVGIGPEPLLMPSAGVQATPTMAAIGADAPSAMREAGVQAAAMREAAVQVPGVVDVGVWPMVQERGIQVAMPTDAAVQVMPEMAAIGVDAPSAMREVGVQAAAMREAAVQVPGMVDVGVGPELLAMPSASVQVGPEVGAVGVQAVPQMQETGVGPPTIFKTEAQLMKQAAAIAPPITVPATAEIGVGPEPPLMPSAGVQVGPALGWGAAGLAGLGLGVGIPLALLLGHDEQSLDIEFSPKITADAVAVAPGGLYWPATGPDWNVRPPYYQTPVPSRYPPHVEPGSAAESWY